MIKTVVNKKDPYCLVLLCGEYDNNNMENTSYSQVVLVTCALRHIYSCTESNKKRKERRNRTTICS